MQPYEEGTDVELESAYRPFLWSPLPTRIGSERMMIPDVFVQMMQISAISIGKELVGETSLDRAVVGTLFYALKCPGVLKDR